MDDVIEQMRVKFAKKIGKKMKVYFELPNECLPAKESLHILQYESLKDD